MPTPSAKRSPRPGAASLALVATLTFLGVGRAEAISGVCPDGSIFIVQDASAIPCPGAKNVDPNDMPPLNPEFLPRPYGWDVFNRESDPNNPYNLVDLGRPGAGSDARDPVQVPTPGLAPAPRSSGVALPPAPALGVAAPPPSRPQQPRDDRVLELSESEVRDLMSIVDVLQDRAPATLVQRDADQRPGLQVRFARSSAFETRLAGALAARNAAPAGPVVVYHVQADAPGEFWGNLTFVQGHVAFTPDLADPTQFGVVDGELGQLGDGGRIVGYAALPAHADPSQPIDVYWNDRRLTAVFSP